MSGYQVVTVTSLNNDDSPKTVTASCPTGKVVIGGGATNNATSNTCSS